MASSRLTDSQTFPEERTVKAWPTRVFAPSPPQLGQAPPASIAPSAEAVFSGGSVTLTGLAASTSYAAGLQLSGVWTWVFFFTPGESAEGPEPEPGPTLEAIEALIATAGLIVEVPRTADHLLNVDDLGTYQVSTKETGELKLEIPTAAELAAKPSAPFPPGGVVLARAHGAAVVKLVPRAGVTLTGVRTNTEAWVVPAGDGVAWLYKTATLDTWVAVGCE